MFYDNAKMGCLGLYFATNLAVNPFSVITIIKLAWISDAVFTAAEQTDSCVLIGDPVYFLIRS